MILAIVAAIAANPTAIANIDLAAPTIYVSGAAREAIANGTVDTLSCVELPKRSRQFRVACVTAQEWKRAAAYAEISARNLRQDQAVFLAQNFASERD